jgi:hypothetical protein
MLEVSFNSPQCGWMSIGFADPATEFHTTTAHSPYDGALAELMNILADMVTGTNDTPRTLKWNRDPEAFDIMFQRLGENMRLRIYEYPTDVREPSTARIVFEHTGRVEDVASAFAATFDQLYADRETDEFEFNWRQPFPYEEYERFKNTLAYHPKIADEFARGRHPRSVFGDDL